MFISVTRLRLRSFLYFLPFLYYSRRSTRQAAKSPGMVEGATLLDRKLAFWTLTAWETEKAMRAYRGAGAHRDAMPKLAHWCDEAAVTHWDQPGPGLPSWEEAHRRMLEHGRISHVNHPSADHETRNIPPPRTTLARPVRKHSK